MKATHGPEGLCAGMWMPTGSPSGVDATCHQARGEGHQWKKSSSSCAARSSPPSSTARRACASSVAEWMRRSASKKTASSGSARNRSRPGRSGSPRRPASTREPSEPSMVRHGKAAPRRPSWAARSRAAGRVAWRQRRASATAWGAV
ncbi:hypothetical protein SFUMM280S_10933 [Streptomyces fumanus]